MVRENPGLTFHSSRQGEVTIVRKAVCQPLSGFSTGASNDGRIVTAVGEA
jgi:hypothetical protein